MVSATTHKHPHGENISSQRSSDLFANISNDSRERFFYKQGKRRTEKEFWAYDTTSISSYSKYLKQVKYGVNKDHDPLPQINLAMLFGETSGLPFYYRKLAGNITDVITVKSLLKDMDAYGFKKVKLVMDRVFYSEANVDFLYKDHRKFLMGTKNNLIWIQNEIKKFKNTINSWENYIEQYNIYAQTSTIKWEYKEKRPIKKDTLKNLKECMYIFTITKERKQMKK
ncbi:MAG: transposase [Bacillota bacterium]|nr:transposase [Bacillota bacterium]